MIIEYKHTSLQSPLHQILINALQILNIAPQLLDLLALLPQHLQRSLIPLPQLAHLRLQLLHLLIRRALRLHLPHQLHDLGTRLVALCGQAREILFRGDFLAFEMADGGGHALDHLNGGAGAGGGGGHEVVEGGGWAVIEEIVVVGKD